MELKRRSQRRSVGVALKMKETSYVYPDGPICSLLGVSECFEWTTSSYFLSASSAISFACANCVSRMPTLSSSMLVRFSRAFRILFGSGKEC